MAPPHVYEFKPHERPFLPGSPATPDHPRARRIGYAAIGVLIALTGGLSNGLLLANLPQIQGSLGLTPVEGGWLTAAYSMTNACMSFLLIKFRQQFGLQKMTRIFLLGFVALAVMQVFVQSYATELAVRAAAGVIASGFTPLGFFYIMQAMPAKARMSGMILGVGLTQVALPLSRLISPLLLANGDIRALFIFELGLALLCLGGVALLRLPPSERIRALEPLDFLTFALLAPGMALLTAVLVQGRIVWWTTDWLGYALAASVLLVGGAMLIEHNRANPLLNTRWMLNRNVVRFACIAASMRVLLSEQNYGSVGLLTVVGMGPDQLVGFYAVLTLATLAGLLAGVLLMKPHDMLRQIVIAVALVGIGAAMDAHSTNLTRPANLYLSQALIAFAAVFFLAPTMMGGILRALARGPSHIVSYSAVFSLSQTIGGLGGTALLGTVQIMRERFHSNELVQSVVLTDPLIAQRLQALGSAYGRVVADPVLRQGQGSTLFAQQITRESHILAYNDTFLLIAILAGVTFVWLGSRWLFLRLRGVNPLGEEQAALQRMMASRR